MAPPFATLRKPPHGSRADRAGPRKSGQMPSYGCGVTDFVCRNLDSRVHKQGKCESARPDPNYTFPLAIRPPFLYFTGVLIILSACAPPPHCVQISDPPGSWMEVRGSQMPKCGTLSPRSHADATRTNRTSLTLPLYFDVQLVAAKLGGDGCWALDVRCSPPSSAASSNFPPTAPSSANLPPLTHARCL
jgi:hypothetical protein